MAVALPDKQTKPEEKVQPPCRVVLYNDDWHTFDEVALQIVKATGCDPETAWGMAVNVDRNGREVVFHGARAACEKVAGVLRQIRLQTEVDGDF